MAPIRIDVATPSRAYPVIIETAAIDHLGRMLDELQIPERRFVVSSPLVWRLHGLRLSRGLGGKVGVNHPQGKNLIGCFYQPHAVVIDPSLVSTLPRREFRAGLYEVVKYGMTSSAGLFDQLSRDRTAIFTREPAVLTPIITES